MSEICEFQNMVVDKRMQIPDVSVPQGSDPRLATCRGKLQNRRSKLNQEINKELRLRAGAENLLKAATNRKLRETIAIELSFVNSNLQLLKEQLAELNSSVELYQNDSTDAVMPMIPLGLKETKEVDFRDSFKDFILEHYSEDSKYYDDIINEFMDTRQAMRTPLRNSTGITSLFKYYNQLYFIERRFFPPDRSLGIYFEWYDSLTGVPSCQRTVAFEKACVLFNIGAIYTQIGVKQDRKSTKGLDAAVDNFLRAAGIFRYIHENFTNAPSMDLGLNILEMLVHLMLAQARECLLEKLDLQSKDNRSIDIYFDLAHEAAYLSESYNHTYQLTTDCINYIPFSWTCLMQVKKEYFTALAHYYMASGLLNEKTTENENRGIEGKLLGKTHLKEALVMQEECQRLHRMCRELKGKKALFAVLNKAHQQILQKYLNNESEFEFTDINETPQVQAKTKFQLAITSPDFAQYRVNDLFKKLGPIAIFSAKRHWTAPRVIQLCRGKQFDGFGFSVRGDAPVIIAIVECNSLAELAGVKEGDFIVSIGDKDVKWSSHNEVVYLIKNAGDYLILKLVTPMDKNYLKPAYKNKDIQLHKNSTASSDVSTPAGSISQCNASRKFNWNPFKKHHSFKEGKDFFDNIIFR